jgi:DMSO/TMAO reductase YedYZ molybdopterin-dependent catalytic subunit
VSTSDWRLDVGGHCENPFSLTWDEFLALPQTDDVSDFHCVTTWSRMDNHWRGVRFRTLAERCVPRDDARFVLCTGYDEAPGLGIPYTTNLPLARAVEDDVMLVHTWEGQPLPREHGGPCRMITPKLYAWKGTKWIRKIEFLPANKRGFWEERGYSDTAEPWFNDRYNLRPAKRRSSRAGGHFAPPPGRYRPSAPGYRHTAESRMPKAESPSAIPGNALSCGIRCS